jgi:hypothetical protein
MLLSPPQHRFSWTMLLALIIVALARCQTVTASSEAPPAVNEISPSSPEMNQGPAVEVEDESDPSAFAINMEIEVRSRYVFRGLALSEGFVVQPTLSLVKRGYTFSVFGNLNGSRKSGLLEGPRQLNEVDYTFTKSFEKGKTTLEPGFVYYDYPTNTYDKTGEFSFNLSRRVGTATLFFNNNLDILEYEGAYFGEIGVSQEHAFSERTTGAATLSLGFANGKFNQVNIGSDKSAWNMLGLGASFTYQLNSRLYLRPHLNYTRILDFDLRNELDEPDVLEGGVALGFDF